MYQESQHLEIHSQCVRQILISYNSKIVAIKYQEQWLLYNLMEKKSKILYFTRSGPGMFSPDSNYFIAVGVNYYEQKESVALIQVQPLMENPQTILTIDNQVRCLDINNESNKLLLNLMNGSMIVWDIEHRNQVFDLKQSIRYDYTQFFNTMIVGTQAHSITFFDIKRMIKVKRIYVSGRLSEYQKYTHYCDIKQITTNLLLFRQTRGQQQYSYRIINNSNGKMLRIFRDCQRFENLNVNVSPDHKHFAKPSKLQCSDIELLEIDSGKSYNYFNSFDTKQPICFSNDWNMIIQSTKHGYAKVYRKVQ